MTSSAFGEFDIDAADLLKNEKKYGASTRKMKSNITYTPPNVKQNNPMQTFKTFEDDSVLVGFKRNRIEEHSYGKKRVITNSYMVFKDLVNKFGLPKILGVL